MHPQSRQVSPESFAQYAAKEPTKVKGADETPVCYLLEGDGQMICLMEDADGLMKDRRTRWGGKQAGAIQKVKGDRGRFGEALKEFRQPPHSFTALADCRRPPPLKQTHGISVSDDIRGAPQVRSFCQARQKQDDARRKDVHVQELARDEPKTVPAVREIR